MKKITITTIFILIILNFYGQAKRRIDSITNLIHHTSNNVEKLRLINEKFDLSNIRDSAVIDTMLQQGLLLSKRLDNRYYESVFTLNLGYLYGYHNNRYRHMEYLKKGTKLAGSNTEALALAWYRMADYYTDVAFEKSDSAILCFLKSEQYYDKLPPSRNKMLMHQFFAYAYGNNQLFDKQLIVARKMFAVSNQYFKNNPDDLANANFTVAMSYGEMYKTDTVRFASYLDSATYFYKQNFLLSAQQLNKPLVISDSYYNLAVLYSEKSNKLDSCLYYLDKSFEIAGKRKGYEIKYIFKAFLLTNANKLNEATSVLDSTLVHFPATLKNPRSAISYYKLKSRISEKQLDFKNALAYKQLELNFSDSLYDAKKIVALKKTEAEFKNYQQAQELISKKRQNTFYLILALLSFICAIFTYRYYVLRKRHFLKEQVLLQYEKEASDLKLKLVEEESVNHIMAKELAENEKMLTMQELLLTTQQKEQLHHELMSSMLHIDRKNDLIKEIKSRLPQVQKIGMSETWRLTNTINKNLADDEELEFIKKSLEKTNPNFFAKLQQKASNNLTQLDLKYCAYLKIGMSNKEIANVMSVEPKSISMAKYRIKQKLNLSKEEDLDIVIATFA